MKKTLLALGIFLMATVLSAQEFKISMAPTINNIFHYRSVQGGPHGSFMPGFYTQADYFFKTDKKVEFGIGLNYQLSNVSVKTPYSGTNDYTQSNQRIDLISLSFETIINLKKHFYLNLSPILALQLSSNLFRPVDDQSGLGLSFGLGKNIKLNESLFLSIEPQIRIYNIVPFQKEDLPFRLTTAGLNLGLVFGKNIN